MYYNIIFLEITQYQPHGFFSFISFQVSKECSVLCRKGLKI